MEIKIEEETKFKFFKWVIFSKTVITNNKVIINEPVYVPNLEYFKKEFIDN